VGDGAHFFASFSKKEEGGRALVFNSFINKHKIKILEVIKNMPKEWVLNSANMRWGLNKKKQVGAVGHASGSEKDKKAALEKTAISWWAEVITWREFKKNFWLKNRKK